MKKQLKKGFTLVELIIVIAIIAILAVTAFLLLTQRLSKARDSRRVADISTISKSLNISYAEKSKYPKPSDNIISITTSGSTNIIGYQGNFGEGNKSELGINGEIKDPNTNELYTYKVNDSLTNYAILGYTENEMSYQDNQINATDFSKMYPRIDGEAGIIISADKTPVQNVATVVASGYIDIFNTTDTYRVYLNTKEYIEGTGISLQGVQQFGDNGYGAPKSCPNGFVAVPGNKEFKQAGFCVAKYEMKQINGTAGYRNTGETWVSGINDKCPWSTPCYKSLTESGEATTGLNGQIISKADGLPIVNLNQATAIESCKAMGNGYHLITNNERMAIARNIELQPENWNSGIVGSGGIYRGKNLRGKGVGLGFTGNNNPITLDCNMGTDINGIETPNSLLAGGNSTACKLSTGRNKRELKLSNNQWIWDLAGNAYEHVNKSNTINGSGYNLGKTSISNGTSWQEWNSTDVISSQKMLYGPSNQNYTSSNGIGGLYNSTTTNNNILLRSGGGGSEPMWNGIFTATLNNTSNFYWKHTGFRCAK